ncbi:MAG: type 4a pilus biogenesis protein PilO [Planctomycetota bacterium]|nr:type 4a pilus biogenesis protein PilO [Planctomycetota bacterium]
MNVGMRTVCVLLVVVGLPVASYFLVFKPTNAKLDTDREECEQKEKYLTKLAEIGDRDADLVRANEEITRSITLIEQRLPSGKEIDGLVRRVSDLAVAAGLEPPAIKSAKPVPSGIYMEQPLDMEVSGSFLGFFTFLAQMEKLPRITRIHDLKLTGQPKDGVELKAEFTLSIYFQDGAPPVAAGVKEGTSR